MDVFETKDTGENTMDVTLEGPDMRALSGPEAEFAAIKAARARLRKPGISKAGPCLPVTSDGECDEKFMFDPSADCVGYRRTFSVREL